MTRRFLLIASAAIVVLLFLGLFVQVQRPGTARVQRSGQSIRTVRTPLGFAPRFTPSCVTERSGKFLRFNGDVIVTDADERQFPAQVRFDYLPPASLPEGWPRGDWCSALIQRVGKAAAQWTASAPRDALLADRRDANRGAAEALQKTLEAQGLQVRNLTVRFIVPDILAGARTVPEIAAQAKTAPPVIFIGLDGADWTLLDGYMNEGLMPNLAALVREGKRGTLKTRHPPLSPLLWNTMMTGVSPLEHRILDFTRFHPQSRTKEPITADERRAPAVWNMATQGGKSVAVLGLWATYPAEPVRGLLVSDRFFTFLFTEETPPPGVVFPPSRESWARGVRTNAENNVGFERLKEYLPWLSESEFQSYKVSKNPYEHPVSALQRILVETDVYHSLAKDYLATRTPDLAVVYFQGTDSIGHVFAPFNPPRQPEISEDDFHKYSDVARRYFQQVDRILGEYRDLAAKERAVLMLASDHGFRWHEGRPTQLSSFDVATAAKWHRDEGIYLLWGPGIKPERGPQSSIDQVAATLLDLAGLPPGEGLAGPSLTGAATRRSRVNYADHFRPIPAGSAPRPEEVSEEIAKLRALGYVGATESTSAPEGTTRTGGSHNNEALILRGQGKEREAIAAFEAALEVDPNLASAAWNLSDLLHRQNSDLERSDELLVRSFENGLPEGIKFVVGRAIGYQRAGQMQRSLDLLEKAVRAQPSDPELRLFRGRYRIDRGDCSGALEDFRAAQQLTPRNPIAFASAGIAEICLGNQSAAATHFRRALEIDPNQPRIRAYLQSLPAPPF